MPAVYAGSAARLAAIVRLVCAEMGAAFAERGTVTPPWRSAQSLLSKWLPSKVRGDHALCVKLVCGLSRLRPAWHRGCADAMYNILVGIIPLYAEHVASMHLQPPITG